MKQHTFSISLTRLARASQSVAVVCALTVVMLLIGPKMLGEGVIALLYLVPIGWCTIRWGQVAGVSAALTAAMSFDYLFIPPYGTLNIGSLEGWLLLCLFIGASILVVGRIQTVLADEQNRARKATFLYEMVAAIASQPTREGIARTIANQIQQKFMADVVQVHLNGRGRMQPLNIRADGCVDPLPARKPDRALPIISGPALIGEIDVWKGILPLPVEEDLMVQTMLQQTAAALDRVVKVEGIN